MSRLPVAKTYKLFIGGAFPRSESGRVYDVVTPGGDFIANAAKASRKDARDAVVAARGAFAKWSGATAYNRGQVMYRIAEMLEGRTAQFVAEIQNATGVSVKDATAEVHAAIDRFVWYAGWTDKYAQVVGGANPVTGPFFNLSVPEPTGVVVSVATQSESTLLGVVEAIAPALVTGNTVVVLASESHPCAAMSFAEVIATSDVPGGVVNILTGSASEIMPWMASHQDVNALDLSGAAAELALECERGSAETLKRVVRPGQFGSMSRSVDRIGAFVETKTVWHTKSLA